MEDVKEEIIPETTEKGKLTKREFLKKAGLLITGATLLGTTAFRPDKKPEDGSETEKEVLTPWEKKKREEIENVFGFDKEKGEFKELIPFSEFKRLNIEWPPSGMPKEDLTPVNRELKEKYGFELRCGWQVLLNYAVTRYQEILRDPYKTVIDPTKEEVDLLIETFSELTGLPEDFIKTIGFRENGLRGNNPGIHGMSGERFYPASGDGMTSPCVHEDEKLGPVWGKRIEVDGQSKEIGYFKAYKREEIVVPVPSKVIIEDQAANLAFGLAIYIEHLSQLMTHPDFEVLKEFVERKGSQLENAPAALMGVSFAAYHHGLESFNSWLERWLSSAEQWGRKEENLGESYYLGFPMQKAIDTFSSKPWNDPDYFTHGLTPESKSLTFYYLLSAH